MAKKKKNLSEIASSEQIDGTKFKVALVVSRWNPEITEALLEASMETLKKAKVSEENLKIVHVPGAFELPVGAKMLLASEGYDGVICLGCVIKGETAHNEYISNAVATGLTQLSLISSKPCIFGLLTPNTMEQALDRAGGKHGNKGHEAAATLLEMIALKKSLTQAGKKIGF